MWEERNVTGETSRILGQQKIENNLEISLIRESWRRDIAASIPPETFFFHLVLL